MNVLFVCTGNTCRSPMAAAYLRHLCRQRGLTGVQVSSAGTAATPGSEASPQARFALWECGVRDDEPAPSRQLSRDLVREADRILCMTGAHLAQVRRLDPGAGAKSQTLLSVTGDPQDVPDPFGGSVEDYIACLTCMRPALDALAADLAGDRRGRPAGAAGRVSGPGERDGGQDLRGVEP